MSISKKKVARALSNAKISMELEGFTISDELMEHGRRILLGEEQAKDVVAKYVKEAHEWSARHT